MILFLPDSLKLRRGAFLAERGQAGGNFTAYFTNNITERRKDLPSVKSNSESRRASPLLSKRDSLKSISHPSSPRRTNYNLKRQGSQIKLVGCKELDRKEKDSCTHQLSTNPSFSKLAEASKRQQSEGEISRKSGDKSPNQRETTLKYRPSVVSNKPIRAKGSRGSYDKSLQKDPTKSNQREDFQQKLDTSIQVCEFHLG